jgi:hypothetical protein
MRRWVCTALLSIAGFTLLAPATPLISAAPASASTPSTTKTKKHKKHKPKKEVVLKGHRGKHDKKPT